MNKLEIVFTKAAPAFGNLFMGCVLNINTVHMKPFDPNGP